LTPPHLPAILTHPGTLTSGKSKTDVFSPTPLDASNCLLRFSFFWHNGENHDKALACSFGGFRKTIARTSVS
jgi:hypothetical protein